VCAIYGDTDRITSKALCATSSAIGIAAPLRAPSGAITSHPMSTWADTPDKRRWRVRLVHGLILAAGLLAALPAASEPLRIGVAAPLTGASQILGRQIVAGARHGAADASLEVVDDRCDAAGGEEAARRFVEAKVQVAIGFLCMDAIQAALPILSPAGIPVVTPGVRTNALTDQREREGWLVYRLAPRADHEAAAVESLLIRRWRDDLFAIADDGTIYGRELAENLRNAAERLALKPAFVDTYRPQMENQIGLVGRLRRSGATHVFIGGERDDVAVIGRDIAALGAGIDVAAGESLRAPEGDVPLAAGTLMVGLPEWVDVADAEVVAAMQTAGVVAEGYVLPAYAAVQVATAIASAPGSQPAQGPFQTAIGR
jgi:branched-chain amino acid transport system substrate-binding protein